MDDVTRRRLEHNEQVFRSVNDEIDDANGGGRRDYVCECADTGCEETIRLTHEEFAAIRAQPGHYVVVPGHQVPGLEAVVEQAGDHLVVDKNAV